MSSWSHTGSATSVAELISESPVRTAKSAPPCSSAAFASSESDTSRVIDARGRSRANALTASGSM